MASQLPGPTSSGGTDDVDPLDAFMAEINTTVSNQRAESEARAQASAAADDDEVDPLDAFMANIDSTVAKQKPKNKQPKVCVHVPTPCRWHRT